MKKLSAVVVALATLGVASAANATIYNFALTVSDPAAALTSHPTGVDAFGNVSVNDAGGNLAFDVTLNSGFEFRSASDSNHWDFAFNTNKAFTYSGITWIGGGAATETESTGVNASPFGSFTNAIECVQGSGGKDKTACQNGWAPGINPTELKFTAVGLALPDLFKSLTTYKSQNMWFIVDVVNSAGKTGNVGAPTCAQMGFDASCYGGGGGGGVPEPSTWALMISGFGLAGAMLRRRRATLAA
jgi:hypothetical protein